MCKEVIGCMIGGLGLRLVALAANIVNVNPGRDFLGWGLIKVRESRNNLCNYGCKLGGHHKKIVNCGK